MTAPDDDTLRAWIAAADPSRPWPGRDAAHDAQLEELACAAPALAAEVLRLRETNRALGPSLSAAREDFHAMEEAYYAMQERAEKAEAERDALRAAVSDFLDTPASCYGVALQGVVDALDGAAPSGIAAAARAYLAAADALSVARRTDAADVPAAEARADAARECLAGLVGYVPGDAPRYVTTSRPGAVIEVQEHRLSPEERAVLDFGRKPFGGAP